MKIGITAINVGGPALAQDLAENARVAEEAGLESVWTFEHAMIPVEYASRYPYSRSGKMPVTPETWFIDPLIALTTAAAVTTTLKLGTGINILPQVQPLLFAKQTASLDVLSGGRLLLGLGVGWLQEEFEAMGTPFARRGARFREYLEAIRKAWSGDVVEHEGELLSWSGFKSYPTPTRPSGPPVIIGGTSEPALRRVVRMGDGWYTPNHSVGQLREQLTRLRTAATAEGRAMDSIEVTAAWVLAKEPDALAEYEDLGVSRLIVPWYATGASTWRAAVDKIAAATR